MMSRRLGERQGPGRRGALKGWLRVGSAVAGLTVVSASGCCLNASPEGADAGQVSTAGSSAGTTSSIGAGSSGTTGVAATGGTTAAGRTSGGASGGTTAGTTMTSGGTTAGGTGNCAQIGQACAQGASCCDRTAHCADSLGVQVCCVPDGVSPSSGWPGNCCSQNGLDANGRCRPASVTGSSGSTTGGTTTGTIGTSGGSTSSGGITSGTAGTSGSSSGDGGVIVTTLAGSGSPGWVDSTAFSAEFNQPYGVAVDGLGNVYVADLGNSVIREVDSIGNVTTLAGNGTRGYADGTGGPNGTAEFNNDYSVTLDGAGNLYVADGQNCAIRKVDSGGNVTTVAGNPAHCGYADGTGGPSGTAWLNLPSDVALDGLGNLYVADYNNCAIREIDTNGNVTTIAGNASRCGWADGTGGPNGTAKLNGPYGVAVDGSRNIYVSEVLNSVIRKIDSSGNVTTLAGQPGNPGYVDGVGGPTGMAQFRAPTGIKEDSAGNLYIADVIRLIDTNAGVVSTLAGNGRVGRSNGTGGPSGTAEFWFDHGVALDSSANVYVGDVNNNLIRLISR